MIGQRIGKYRVIREIGRGGMGLVYEAQHETMPRLRAAIKVLHASATTEEYQRLEREARVLSSLQDSGIVRLEDFGSLENGRLYLRMEYLEGETLDHRLARLGRLPGRQALELARQMATTLSRIHGDHILHRDLKPANIMIVRDSQAEGGELARLLDFGIAKLLCSEQSHSITLQPMGTPLYMSPEQGEARATLTDRSDVYQLGLVLYEMLSGAVPYEVSADSLPIALHIQRLTEPPTPLRQHLPGLPSAVADLVDAMLQRSPAARPSMAAIAQRLKQLLSELPNKVDWKRPARSLRSALPSRAPSQASRETLGFGSDSRRENSDLTAELTRQSLSARVWGPLAESGWGRWLHTSGRRRLPGLLALFMAIFLASPLPGGQKTESLQLAGSSALRSNPEMAPAYEAARASSVTPVGLAPSLPWHKLDCAQQPKVEGMAC
ncbi:MAG TPA: serine/threonine-protein kinase, partial [Pseudomonadota bacterium]|nr:serine/threonine-protein kinase [Pseudomonadota bacterium]